MRLLNRHPNRGMLIPIRKSCKGTQDYAPYPAPSSDPLRRGYDRRQYHRPSDSLCAAAAGGQHLSAAIQHGGYMGGGQFRLQRGLLRRRHSGPHRQYAHRLLSGLFQRRRRGHQPVLRRTTHGEGPRRRPHGAGADGDPVCSIHGAGHRLYAPDAAFDEHPCRGVSGVLRLSDHLFRRHQRPTDLQHGLRHPPGRGGFPPPLLFSGGLRRTEHGAGPAIRAAVRYGCGGRGMGYGYCTGRLGASGDRCPSANGADSAADPP